MADDEGDCECLPSHHSLCARALLPCRSHGLHDGLVDLVGRGLIVTNSGQAEDLRSRLQEKLFGTARREGEGRDMVTVAGQRPQRQTGFQGRWNGGGSPGGPPSLGCSTSSVKGKRLHQPPPPLPFLPCPNASPS